MTCPARVRCIRHDDAVSNAAIMRHMTVSHEKIMAAYYRDPMSSLGASIEGYEFAENIIFAYFEACWFSLELQILRVGPDGVMTVKMTIPADRRPTIDTDMGIEDDAVSYGGMRPNDAIRADRSFGGNFRCFINYRSRVYRHAISKYALLSVKRDRALSKIILLQRPGCHLPAPDLSFCSSVRVASEPLPLF